MRATWALGDYKILQGFRERAVTTTRPNYLYPFFSVLTNYYLDCPNTIDDTDGFQSANKASNKENETSATLNFFLFFKLFIGKQNLLANSSLLLVLCFIWLAMVTIFF